MNPEETAEAVLIALKSDDAQLARVEFLVVVGAILMMALFIMDAYRLRSNSSFVRAVLLIFETVTTPLVIYTIGLLQNLSFKNQFLAIWGVLLNLLQPDTEFITAYSITNASMQLRTDLKNLLMTFFSVNLNATKGSNFQGLLWVLWSVGPIMIFYKIIYYELARKSYSHGQNSKVLVEYMKKIEAQKNQQADEVNPTNMKGYKYIVYGEDDKLDIVTLEKVWNCPGRLLKDHDRKLILKDVCLSYALHKLLRCEMADLSLTSECHKMTQRLLFEGVLQDKKNDKRVFRIMEMQIAFLNDYSHTRLPMTVWYGYPLVKIGTLLGTMVTVGLLAFNVHETDTKNDFYHLKKGPNIDRIITYVLLVLIVLKDTWEMALYTFSDWTKLVIICWYVQGLWFMRNCLVECIILLLSRTNLVMRWHNKMSQYNFLESFNYKPWLKKKLHYLTLHAVQEPKEGGKFGRRIKIFEEVKESIVKALCLIETNGVDLTNGMPCLYRHRVTYNYQWACTQETCSHLLLVFHIATSMCEIHLSEELKLQIKRPWLNSCLQTLKVFWSHRNPFLVDLESLERLKGKQTRAHYIVANSISRYCAYLFVSAPELLPDHAHSSCKVFEAIVKDARSFLGDCRSLKSVLGKLMEREEGAGDTCSEVSTIVNDGAKLGKALLTDKEMDVEARWKMLAEFWVDLLLFLAPSKMMEDHRSHLIEGGEFITLFWALFSNCGIFDRADQEHQVPV